MLSAVSSWPLSDKPQVEQLVDPERVSTVRELMLSPDDAERLAGRFQLLGDPVRLRMVYALLEGGELCVRDLAAVVAASESGTSHQLRQLRLAGLVRTRKQGRVVFYRVADSHVRLLLDVAVEHYLHDHEDHR
ncbi:MAG: helix-turn-helix transcriptional regulator [Acidimicrobiia bacterium]|nr:helix-turn-helix transcriptional regulator [Acidimicrobiia bacterium]